jgi:maleylpyruvate isomerase
VRDNPDLSAATATMLSAGDWVTRLDLPGGPQPAALVPWRRLREVEVHHVDLAGGYTPADWPEAFAHRVLHEVATGLDGAALTVRPDGVGHRIPVGGGGPPEVSGPAYALAAWLAGRSPGDGLTIDPPGPLPLLPDWR